jgi:hypothetical protein
VYVNWGLFLEVCVLECTQKNAKATFISHMSWIAACPLGTT